jgi:hypothetical protein
VQFECQEEALETALVAIGELKDQLDSSNITRGGKRRRAEQAEPTIDLGQHHQARGARRVLSMEVLGVGTGSCRCALLQCDDCCVVCRRT